MKKRRTAKRKKSGRLKLKWWIPAIMSLIIMGSILENKDKQPPTPKASAQIESDTKKTTIDGCNAKLQKAKEPDINDNGQPGDSLLVSVDPTCFHDAH